ncbi:MAG: hypothetical protein HGA47_02550 [Zoogloea sp.]|nr:hypothetical protein [Zoogloea sp.]
MLNPILRLVLIAGLLAWSAISLFAWFVGASWFVLWPFVPLAVLLLLKPARERSGALHGSEHSH